MPSHPSPAAPARRAPALLRRGTCGATLAALALTLLAAPGPAAAAPEAPDDGLVVEYELDETGGTTVADTSGNGRHGTVSGDATWLGGDGLALGGVNGHVRLPNDVLRGLSDITVSTEVRIDRDQPGPYFIWGLGNTTDWYGDGYLFTTGNSYRTSIATGNWSTEQTVSAGRDLARETWKTLTYTLSDGTAVLYEDGVEVGRQSGITITPGMIGGGRTTANYLGRSNYTPDKHLKGQVRDFRIYDRALSSDEVRRLGPLSDEERVAGDLAALDLGNTSAVTGNLGLPATGANGTRLTWASSDPAVVSTTGAVTRPRHGAGDATVTLTVTSTIGTTSSSRSFTVRVLQNISDEQKVREAAADLVVWDAAAVRGNLTLPTTGLHGTSIRWESGDPGVVTTTGEVRRPAAGRERVRLNLHAFVSLGKTKVKRTFRVTVLPLPKQEPMEGYAFAYFAGEGYADGEQVYFAASRGNDALHWDELNGGEPVLRSTFGDQGVRDPFIIRSPEGDKFYLIATDLKIHGNGNWDAAQRTGSKHIEVWESTDLVNWSEQRHVRVAPDTAGNTWAPEAYYDDRIGAYVVFWASKLYAADDPNHTGNTHNRMVYVTTRDFRTFSEPKVWIDPGYSVIDSTVIKHGDTYHRITKDERSAAPDAPCGKFLVQEKSTDLLDTSWDFVSECIGKSVPGNPGVRQGEGPTVFKSNTEDKWYLFIDEFGGRGYVPFETTDLDSGTWTLASDYQLPSRPRHGTVVPVTKAELERLRAALG
ncbi:glycosyl hydrolase family 43 [Kineococcus xinjiangensis]|uniref:Glycosyl hydrolase family 43 n=1 Tax=Kineococcus xinjiangensis TaxID=512762 RepID=A0A2S6IG43_9ACTN|nr:immunoglobulin-like domain-containing protein [Kineococcus xinjiangensis]PPK93182.1 glycosyl hydrolase family 43 [Kineococcus xinjiangensis]